MAHQPNLAFLLALAIPLAGMALEVDPPEVPNPYNTSEGRAIRDVLLEQFKIKAAETLSVEALRALYRKTWNADQENRCLDGREADPRYIAAKKEEESRREREKLRAELEKQGGTADASATEEELKLAISTRKADIERQNQEKEAAERKRAAEELSHQIEVEQASAKPPLPTPGRGTQRPFGQSRDSKNDIILTPVLTAKDGLTDEQIIARMKLIRDLPTMSAFEHAEVVSAAKEVIERRNRLIKDGHGKRILVSDDGIEVWETHVTGFADPEKMILQLDVVNMTTRYIDIRKISIVFGGKTRNQDVETSGLSFIVPGAIMRTFNNEYYNDSSQTISISVFPSYRE